MKATTSGARLEQVIKENLRRLGDDESSETTADTGKPTRPP